ncbi:MAG: leucine--tRNA ligase [Endozoicomonadaceae bacterium]|nr:leucine--tRNA ligase [Endozoicomonadaceae bacterium]
MNDQYHPQKIEEMAQKYWEQHQTFKTEATSDKEKFYCLSMFPYPSGQLHVGHVRNYTLGDVIARFKRMKGYHVMHPIGWDAFGMPAEGAAIKHQTAPADWTYQNIAAMTVQLKKLGFSFDWTREMTTCKPEYYKWEQWLFTILYQKGLIYRKFSAVNWCPQDETVLANEQVENGRCWRCDTLVERKELPQWFLKITDYSDELLAGLEELSAWPEQVKAMQKNWIGRSEGIDIDFKVFDSPVDQYDILTAYTTRPDTLMGVNCLVLAAEHPLSLAISEKNTVLATFIQTCKQTQVSETTLSVIEKKGMNLGLEVAHPLTGERLPVWVANYVLMDYGSGVVMSVPGHDKRDWEFAKSYYLPIKQVIASKTEIDIEAAPFLQTGCLIQSGEFDHLDCQVAWRLIADRLVKEKKAALKVNYRLRDWGISRQRYWGTPIPMCYLEDDTVMCVPEEELPVILPESVHLNGMQSPLKEDLKWQQIDHKGQLAKRETDTLDTFIESSWYYARFCCPHFQEGMLDVKQTQYWLPVDQYVGGIEHACMHLLYARFFHKILRDLDLVQCSEPFKRLLCQGMVLADAFYIENEAGVKSWIAAADVTIERNEKGRLIQAKHTESGQLVSYAGMLKMSKSKQNGIDPQSLILHYGADTVRLYLLFAAPPEQQLEWSSSGTEGAYRFLKKLWKMVWHDLDRGALPAVNKAGLNKLQKKLYQHIHQVIHKVTDDIDRRQTFNTAISSIMELLNALSKQTISKDDQDAAIHRAGLQAITCLLAPMTPHISHVLWQKYALEKEMTWPLYDPDMLIVDQVTYVVQVNGKMRARFEAETNCSEDTIFQMALSQKNVKNSIGNQSIKKMIWVPNKLVSIVLSS